MKKTAIEAETTPSKAYRRTAREEQTLARIRETASRSAPRITVEQKGGVSSISVDHPDVIAGLAHVIEAVGCTDTDFFNGFISQIANATSKGQKADADGINFMLSVIKGIEPRDQIEAMLAAQMAAVHNATMSFARRLTYVETIQQQDSASNAFNKLARTFATQLEALKRYRSTGEQEVTVQHVQVNDGGQAIVGNVSTRGGGTGKKVDTTP